MLLRSFIGRRSRWQRGSKYWTTFFPGVDFRAAGSLWDATGRSERGPESCLPYDRRSGPEGRLDRRAWDCCRSLLGGGSDPGAAAHEEARASRSGGAASLGGIRAGGNCRHRAGRYRGRAAIPCGAKVEGRSNADHRYLDGEPENHFADSARELPPAQNASGDPAEAQEAKIRVRVRSLGWNRARNFSFRPRLTYCECRSSWGRRSARGEERLPFLRERQQRRML